MTFMFTEVKIFTVAAPNTRRLTDCTHSNQEEIRSYKTLKAVVPCQNKIILKSFSVLF